MKMMSKDALSLIQALLFLPLGLCIAPHLPQEVWVAAWGSVKCSQERPVFLKPDHVHYLNCLRGL